MEFDHERLDVYQLALRFDAMVANTPPKRGTRVVRDQLERASLSVLLNIAEGTARRASSNERRHFYAIARGSAAECSAALDALVHRRMVNAETHTEARALLVRVVSMLSRLSL